MVEALGGAPQSYRGGGGVGRRGSSLPHPHVQFRASSLGDPTPPSEICGTTGGG